MTKPKVLIFNRTDKIFTGAKSGHFIVSTCEIRHVIEEIERKEKHGSQGPLDHETGEHSVLKIVVSRHFLNQALEIVGLRHG